MSEFRVRTDLALEAKESFEEDHVEIHGVRIEEKYDEENEIYRIFDEESVIDKENNSISYTTTHFSTYMVVDKKKWYATWSKNIDYKRRGTEPVPVPYYDFVYTVDCSGSMKGDRMSMAKKH